MRVAAAIATALGVEELATGGQVRRLRTEVGGAWGGGRVGTAGGEVVGVKVRAGGGGACVGLAVLRGIFVVVVEQRGRGRGNVRELDTRAR